MSRRRRSGSGSGAAADLAAGAKASSSRQREGAQDSVIIDLDAFRFSASVTPAGGSPAKKLRPLDDDALRSNNNSRNQAITIAAKDSTPQQQHEDMKVAVSLTMLPHPPAAVLKVPHDLHLLPPPFISPAPGRWREKYSSVCETCHKGRVTCLHYSELPLRLLLVGHNPSEHAYASGFFYSNPTNNMLKLLRESGLMRKDWPLDWQNRMPAQLGIGFTDIGTVPGNDASKYSREVMVQWRQDFFKRLLAHVQRAHLWATSSGANINNSSSSSPRIIAFTGKRQWLELFDRPPLHRPFGPQPSQCRPPGWPLDDDNHEVWVLPSSSGRAVMTKEERLGPYRCLAERVGEIPWTQEGCGEKGERDEGVT
eukprot:jgi/Chlat1/7812/Chrsp66S07335